MLGFGWMSCRGVARFAVVCACYFFGNLFCFWFVCWIGFGGVAAVGFGGVAAVGFGGVAAVGFGGVAAVGFGGVAAVGFWFCSFNTFQSGNISHTRICFVWRFGDIFFQNVRAIIGYILIWFGSFFCPKDIMFCSVAGFRISSLHKRDNV